MKKSLVILFLSIVSCVFAGNRSSVKTEGNKYVVLASRAVEQDADWKNSKDAIQRGMQKLKGGCPADPPYKMNK